MNEEAENSAAPAVEAAPVEAAPAVEVAPVAEQLAALQAQIAELTAARDTATADAEAARVAAMSDAEKLSADRAAFAAEADAMRADLRAQRREAALDKLQVLPNYRQYVGDIDPATTEGAAALTEWAKKPPRSAQAHGNGSALGTAGGEQASSDCARRDR